MEMVWCFVFGLALGAGMAGAGALFFLARQERLLNLGADIYRAGTMKIPATRAAEHQTVLADPGVGSDASDDLDAAQALRRYQQAQSRDRIKETLTNPASGMLKAVESDDE